MSEVVVNTGDTINATSVVITNVGDFTGTVLENKIGKAEASMIGNTFRVRGTAQGATAQNPNQVATARLRNQSELLTRGVSMIGIAFFCQSQDHRLGKHHTA